METVKTVSMLSVISAQQIRFQWKYEWIRFQWKYEWNENNCCL